MAIELPQLPYAKEALEPHISSKTLDFHHGKHHQAYVTKTNAIIEGTRYQDMSLEDIIKATANQPAEAVLFNNAAQVWNHTFFWHCMQPNGGDAPVAELAGLIDSSFGGLAQFKEEFKNAAVSQFGSGWAWLVLDGDKLKVTKTPNAVNPMSLNPMTGGQTALFTVDVWEHAYYLDYQNRRPDFVGAVLDKLVNWRFVSDNLKKARG